MRGADDRAFPFGAFASASLSLWQNHRRPLLKHGEVRDRKPHALRHTFASLLLQNRESPAYVKGRMGHSAVEITVMAEYTVRVYYRPG